MACFPAQISTKQSLSVGHDMNIRKRKSAIMNLDCKLNMQSKRCLPLLLSATCVKLKSAGVSHQHSSRSPSSNNHVLSFRNLFKISSNFIGTSCHHLLILFLNIFCVLQRPTNLNPSNIFTKKLMNWSSLHFSGGVRIEFLSQFMVVLLLFSQLGLVCASCGNGRTILTELDGIITDGSESYPAAEECEWLIEAPDPAMSICILFDATFMTECTYDFLHVFDGNSFKSPSLGAFSGNQSPSLLCATSGKMLLFLYSDTNYSLQGFTAYYTITNCSLGCSARGVCNNYQCVCNSGYHGEGCQFERCPDSCNAALGRGTCNYNDGPTAFCECSTGYIGESCSLSTMDDTGWGNTFLLASGNDDAIPPRTGHAMIYYPLNDTLWVFGGFDLNVYLADLWTYSFRENLWSEVQTSGSLYPSGRHTHTMELYRNSLIVFGGVQSGNIFSNELWSFSLKSNEWHVMPTNGSIPNLAHHSSCIVDSHYLYIIGGQTNESSYLDTIYKYDLSSETGWELVTPLGGRHLQIGVGEHSSVYYEPLKSIFVYGGIREYKAKFSQRSNELYAFQVEKKIWAAVNNYPWRERSFQTASIIGDYMVVYGGNAHQHGQEKKPETGYETCYESSLQLYNLKCNEWVVYDKMAEIFAGYGDSAAYDMARGRFGHGAVVRDGTTLVVMGGFGGLPLNDMIAIKMPGSVATNRNASTGIGCRYLLSENNCLIDPACSWCDRRCIPTSQKESCTGSISLGTCPGLCSGLSTCTECLSFGSDNSQQQCGWCVEDSTCSPRSAPSGFCSTSLSSQAWWGKNGTFLEKFDKCLTHDKPPGLTLVTYQKPFDAANPDDVRIVDDTDNYLNCLELTEAKFSRDCYTTLKGFVHPLGETTSAGGSVNLSLELQSGVTNLLWVSPDQNFKNAELVINQTGSLMSEVFEAKRPDSSIAIFPNSSSAAMYYLELQAHYSSINTMKLQWNAGQGAGVRIALTSEYLEPFHQGNCHSHSYCLGCLMDSLCGWCPVSMTCESRSNTSLSVGNCGSDPVEETLHYLITNRQYCSSCYNYTDCITCTEDPHCEWYETESDQWCLRHGTHNDSLTSSTQCHAPCHELSSCSECAKTEVCAWCEETQECFSFKHYIMTFAYGQCSHWFDSESNCPKCSTYDTCNTCLDKFQCGWCGQTDNPTIGQCQPGDFNGPFSSLNCSAIISSNLNVSMEKPADWSYQMCPDVEECILDFYECHENATCINTHESYLCECNRGFEGNGKDTCNRTCFHDCVNGECSGPPHYECICDLGWTGENCSIDCGCNFHSHCPDVIGVCAQCYKNTMGETCDTCEAGYHGDATSLQGCTQCECSGHGDASLGYCNSTTGECFCMENTQGTDCSECVKGFYGDPSSGGHCYQECSGRTIMTGSYSGAVGSFEGDGVKDLEKVRCMWIITPHQALSFARNTSNPPPIQVTINNINTTCGRDYVFIYDGIPSNISGWTDVDSVSLGAFCGHNLTEDINLLAKSGVVTITFQASLKGRYSTTGFTALFNVLTCETGCIGNRVCENGECVCVDGYTGDLCDTLRCPDNCNEDSSKGTCLEATGLCKCEDRFGGASCEFEIWENAFNAPFAVWQTLFNFSSMLETLASDVPSGRVGQSLFATSDKLLILFGGYSQQDGFMNDLWSFDLSLLSWSRITPGNAQPSPRMFHGGVYMSSVNSFYIYGGVSERDVENDLWVFNMNTLLWRKIQSGIVVAGMNTASLPPLAGHTLTAFSNESFYLIGGYSPVENFFPEMLRFDITPGQWVPVVGNNIGIPPIGIYGHSAIWHEATKAVYVYGGYRFYRGEVWTSPALYAFDQIYQMWSILPNTSAYVPSSRLFHSAVTFDSFMIVIGGSAAMNNFTNTILAYSYAHNTWDILPTVGDPPRPGFGQSAVVVDRTIYIYGGFDGTDHGSLHSADVINACVTSDEPPCHLRGCVACNNLTHPWTCVPQDEVIAESCNIALTNGTRGSPVNNSMAKVRCEDFQSCGECVTSFPAFRNSQQYCKWCYSCPNGKCIPIHADCEVENDCEAVSQQDITVANKCSELTCAVSDCDECLVVGGCIWTRQFKPIGETRYLLNKTPEYSWNCFRKTLLDVSPVSYVIETSPPNECPAKCPSHGTCKSCVGSDGADGGWSQCVWSASLQKCMSPSFLYLQCTTGRCGPIVYGASSLCPAPCSTNTVCDSCLKQPGCGWCSVGLNYTMGVCLDGTLQGPSNGVCSSDEGIGGDGLILSDSVQKLAETEGAIWNYNICPPENECLNGHHTCRENEDCIDTYDAYECRCKQGYARKKSTKPCEPVCTQACVNGTCLIPNTCQCNFGYVGESCNISCQCNGHSNCDGVDSINECLECHNNTAGAHCEHCKLNYVGDPRNNGRCLPCASYCNGNTNYCINTSHPQAYGPTVDHVLCVNCSRNSEGDLCDTCVDGYFLHEGSCTLCECNGHAAVCDKSTGTGCDCQNHTSTPTCLADGTTQEPCYKKQCSVCTDDDVYKGVPTNGHQCYKKMEPNNNKCFGGACNDDPQPLAIGHSLFFHLSPIYHDLALRLTVDVTWGGLDVFLSYEEDMFVIELDKDTKLHTVMIDANKPIDRTDIIPQRPVPGSGLQRRNAEEQTITTERPIVNVVREYYAEGLNFFVTITDRHFISLIRNVENRLVVTLPHEMHDLSKRRFSIILQGRGSEGANNTPGVILWRQDVPHIDLFIFFSAFLSSFFKLLAILIAIWKIKVSWESRQAERARTLEMEHRRSRPFGHAIIYMEDIAAPLPPPAPHPSARKHKRLKSPRNRKDKPAEPAPNDVVVNIQNGSLPRPTAAQPLKDKIFFPGMIASEPTDDGMAMVGTVVMALPGGKKAPIQACLASALVSVKAGKHMNTSALHKQRQAQKRNEVRHNNGMIYRPV